MKITGNIPAGVQITKEVHGDAVMLVGDEVLKERIAHLTNLIEEHNAKLKANCVQALRKSGKVREPHWDTQCDHYSRRGRRCPDCPLGYMIDLTDGGK